MLRSFLFLLCLSIGLVLSRTVENRYNWPEEPQSLAQMRARIAAKAYREKNAAHQQPRETVTTCYDPIGCLTTDDTWYDPVRRPFNPEPMSRAEINTRFILRTRERPTQDTMLYAEDPITISNSYFNPNRPTQFLVHGFIDDGSVSWMKRLTDNLLEYGDYNVIIVNWGDGSFPVNHPLYVTATVNTRVVGLEIAYMVNTLISQFGAKASDFHLIGHSLGAHTVGYAGEKIPGLGRITGLDPAEPNFQEMPTWVRLDPTDAQFVDAIHTDTRTILLLGYGMLDPVGHLDFYVNGGRDQPGCDPANIALDAITEDMVTAGRELAACNHLRAIEFFIYSLAPDSNQFVGHECVDYEQYKQGKCVSCGADNLNCARFGMEAVQYPTRSRTLVPFYFQTGKDAPYLKFHYGITVSLANPSEAEEFVWGNIKISLFGTKDQIVSQRITSESMKMYHGVDQLFLYVDFPDVGRIQRVELYWDYDASILDPGSQCGLFCNDHLYVASVQVSEINNYPESSRLENTFRSCKVGAPYADINSRDWDEFYPTACV